MTFRVTCTCGAKDVEVDLSGPRPKFVSHSCGKPLPLVGGAAARPPAKESDESSSRGEKRKKAAASPTNEFSNAKPTQAVWTDGSVVNFRSKMEARVAERLIAECAKSGYTLFRQVRLPLWSIAAEKAGIPMYLTVDFVVLGGPGGRRYIDAKGRLKSRDWLRGTRAAETSGYLVEEVDA